MISAIAKALGVGSDEPEAVRAARENVEAHARGLEATAATLESASKALASKQSTHDEAVAALSQAEAAFLESESSADAARVDKARNAVANAKLLLAKSQDRHGAAQQAHNVARDGHAAAQREHALAQRRHDGDLARFVDRSRPRATAIVEALTTIRALAREIVADMREVNAARTDAGDYAIDFTPAAGCLIEAIANAGASVVDGEANLLRRGAGLLAPTPELSDFVYALGKAIERTPGAGISGQSWSPAQLESKVALYMSSPDAISVARTEETQLRAERHGIQRVVPPAGAEGMAAVRIMETQHR